jgi:hypothetical protein
LRRPCSNRCGSNVTDHIYNTDGSDPAGYTSAGTTGYLELSSATGNAPLYRFVNSSTGRHYYSTTNDQPPRFTQEATLGYLRTSGGYDLVSFYRHYNATTENIFTASRSFAYDALNRLTSASAKFGTNQAIRISLTHTFCFSGLAADICGLRPLKCFDSYFHDLQKRTGDFSNDLHNDFPLGAPTIYALKVKSLAAGGKAMACFDAYNKVIRLRFLV